MIPPGYITLPEALDIIEACIDDDDLHVLHGPPSSKCRRWAAIKGFGEEISQLFSALSLYVMRGGKPSYMSDNVARALVEEGWIVWIESGRVNAEAFDDIDEIFGIAAKERPTTEEHHGCQLLVEESSVRYYWKQQVRPEPPKTGAPGRPSSMDLVMREFARRLLAGDTASSRANESKELARWLADKHPNMPKCGAKAIFNKLPPSSSLGMGKNKFLPKLSSLTPI